MKNNKIVIAVDFDGTCVTHEFPNVGKDIGAVPVLKKLVEKGHQLILWTMRDDNRIDPKLRNVLTDAVKWFEENEIPLWGINNNPTQNSWTESPKAFANIYIDDMALGCPLIYNINVSDRPYVDWERVEQLLIVKGLL